MTAKWVAAVCWILAFLGATAILAEEKPLTEEECVAFAKNLEKEIAAGNAAALAESIDYRLITKCVTDLVDPNTQWQTVANFFDDFNNQRSELVFQYWDVRRKDVKVKLIRVTKSDDQFHALFRSTVFRGEAPVDVDYNDLSLGRDRCDGTLKVSDVLSFKIGETCVQWLLKFWVQTGALPKTALRKAVYPDLVAHAETFRSAMGAALKGPAAEFKKQYEQLPASLQGERIMLAARAHWARQLGQEDIIAADLAIKKAFPDAPWALFVRMEGWFAAKRYDEGLQRLDRLIQLLGPDGYLLALKGMVFIWRNDLNSAAIWARYAFEQEPDYAFCNLTLMYVLLSKKDFAAVKEHLLLLERRNLARFGELTDTQDFAEFVKSPEYQQWLKERPKKEAPAGEKPGEQIK